MYNNIITCNMCDSVRLSHSLSIRKQLTFHQVGPVLWSLAEDPSIHSFSKFWTKNQISFIRIGFDSTVSGFTSNWLYEFVSFTIYLSIDSFTDKGNIACLA